MLDKKTKRDIILAVFLIAICVVIWLFMNISKKTGSRAILTYDTNKVVELPLNKNKVYDFKSNGLNIHIEVKDKKAAFVHSECPDHLCEHYGWLSKGEDLAVCLPAKASLTIKE